MIRASDADETGQHRSLLQRILTVIDAFEHNEWDVSLAELTRRTGLPKPTVYRIARELVRWGALERTEHGYQLGVKLFMLGERVPRQAALRELAQPFLEDLYEATHENTNLGVLHGTDVLYLARVQGHRSSPVVLRVGDTLPAHSTSIGKALLAYARREVVQEVIDAGLARHTARTVVMPGMFIRQLQGVVDKGYAVNDEENQVYTAIVGDTALGGVTYNRAGDRIVLQAAAVYPEFRHQGVATEMIRQVLDDVRAHGKTVTNLCPIVRTFIDKHPEYEDLLDAANPGVRRKAR